MGYLGHLGDIKFASLYKVIGELPRMSQPMYETVHAGLTASEHGIVSKAWIVTIPATGLVAAGAYWLILNALAVLAWFGQLLLSLRLFFH